MTNYEKLCEMLGIEYVYEICNKFKECKNIPCENCKNNVKVYPIFTAEKQIELIKLLMKNYIFTGYTYILEDTKQDNYVLIRTFAVYENTDFAEALAGLTLKLIEIGKIDKEKVKEILQ